MDLFNKKLWLPDMLEDGFARGGDRAFTILQRADGTREETTFAEVRQAGLELVTILKEAGLKKGDRIGVVCSLQPWWFSLLYAALQGGYRMVCIDPGVSLTQIQSMMRRTEVRAVFTTLSTLPLPSVYEGKIPEYALKKGFPLMNGTEKVDTMLNSPADMPEETFFILFSSGTTGETRKGVLLPHTSITEVMEWGMSKKSETYRKTIPFTMAKRDLMLFPPYHIAGLLCATLDLYCSSQIILLEKLAPNVLSTAISELKPDHICTVPSMLTVLKKKMQAGLGKHKLLKKLTNGLLGISGFLRKHLGINAGRFLLGYLNKLALGGNLTDFRIGASPCDPETMCFFLNMGVHVCLSYGLTELGAPLACTGKGYFPGTTGRMMGPANGLDIRIVNPDDQGKGEVEVLSPYRMLTYLDSYDNEGCFTEDGYFRTGDVGYFDKNRCLVICGRAKDAIVLRNGEKLLPEEIEERYKDMKDISEVAVFKLPDEGGCDTFGIAVTKEADKQILPDEVVRLHVLDRAAILGGCFVPKEVYVVRSMPYSSSHKVQRFRLTEMALAGQTNPEAETGRAIEEDSVVAELRQLLVTSGGSQWKTIELTETTLLNLDSLQTMDLLIAVQEHFGLDLFRLARTPETFKDLLDAVTDYDSVEKRAAQTLDLSKYPLPISKAERMLLRTLRPYIRGHWHVYGSGLENIPENESVIFCSNHQTALDPAFIVAVMPYAMTDRLAIVGKRDVIEDKNLKIFARGQHMIPIDRSGNALPTLERCMELMEEGWSVLIFPEGTNYENATGMLKFKEGPARMALTSGKAMVPVHIKGVARVDSNIDSLIPPVSERVDVVFGKPIYPGEMGVAELNAALRAGIEEL